MSRITLTGVTSVAPDPLRPNVAVVAFAAAEGTSSGENDGVPAAPRAVEGRIAFLDEDVVRYVVDPAGAFAPYAKPVCPEHAARIPAQPDDSERYAHPAVRVREEGGAFVVAAGGTEVLLGRSGALLSVRRSGRVVVREAAPLQMDAGSTTQVLACAPDEKFFGGGTQNGRAEHAGTVINIVSSPVNGNEWQDGDVASPSPFFWSSAGYGVLRNTFARGVYDFAATGADVRAAHEDGLFDAYLLVAGCAGEPAAGLAETARAVLRAYYRVTGAPVLLPEYAFYLGHLNAYNRDAWSAEPLPAEARGTVAGAPATEGKAWVVHGSGPAGGAGRVRYEYGRVRGYVLPGRGAAESLNGPDEVLRESAGGFSCETPYEFSARAVIDEHAAHDMPLGWFLPNDGYGSGYGHNGYEMTGGVGSDGASSPERLAAVAANVDNLAAFSAYAAERGVVTGLWAQSKITPDANPDVTWHNLRDFAAETTRGGVAALKTDEEWVGQGYSFALSGTKQAYDILSLDAHRRPFVLTLDGWAATQRFGAVWSGDQDGTDWEYVRMHIPTYLGQGMSGNPNVASDLDGIFGGDPVVATRDFQWKALTPIILDMDGWGAYAKLPYANGDPHTGICRMYLKLKSELMPYAYTCAAAAAGLTDANGDAWLPMVRPLALAGCEDMAPEAANYEFLLGDALLVAPVWRNARADERGNDVRDGIYLPGDERDVWFDYFTGERHAGGQTLDGFDAPLWKLPLFVRGDAIVPRYEAHNNPMPPGEKNPRGLDRTRRVIDFWPEGPAPDGGARESRYVLYEDGGSSIENRARWVEGYGLMDDVSYGGHVETTFRMRQEPGRLVLLAEASTGGYEGYDAFRVTTMRARVEARPAAVEARCAGCELAVREVADRAAFLAEEPAEGEAVWLFEEAPAIETFAPPEERALAAMVAGVHGAPRVSVRFARADVGEGAQEVTLWV